MSQWVRYITLLILAGSSTLAQACGYTGGVGMESFFSLGSLIDIAIFTLLLSAAAAAFS
ncbi:MAG: hypothetical protein KBD60_07830 [Sterolibacterium sp.]|jgi:hypothetical protein|nr:hypothetical protein [Sterolibacterium sp.]